MASWGGWPGMWRMPDNYEVIEPNRYTVATLADGTVIRIAAHPIDGETVDVLREDGTWEAAPTHTTYPVVFGKPWAVD